MKELSEELLEAWLETSIVISNRRLTDGLSYNESLICHILYEKMQAGQEEPMTAADLCRETKMLKSLMNSTLNGLEKKGLTKRLRSTTDKRKIYVCLREENLQIYKREHQKILEIVNRVIVDVGEEKIREFIPVLRGITASVTDFKEKNGTFIVEQKQKVRGK